MSDVITAFQSTDGNTMANMNAKFAQANAEFAKKNQPNGYAGLDANGKLAQMPTNDDVESIPKAPTFISGGSVLSLAPGKYVTIGDSLSDLPTNNSDAYIIYCDFVNQYTALIQAIQLIQTPVHWTIVKKAGTWGQWKRDDPVVIPKEQSIPTGNPDETIIVRYE